MRKILTLKQASQELAYYAEKRKPFFRAKELLIRDYIIIPAIMREIENSESLYNRVLEIQEIRRERKNVLL